jgi:hypothetical protein
MLDGIYLLDDTINVLNNSTNWQICHVRREANSVAHNLAKKK